MALITMTGKLINTFKANDFKNRETGEVTAGSDKIQILGESHQEDGSTRVELQDLSCKDIGLYRPLIGKSIRFPVGAIPNGKVITWFIPKGSKPEALHDQK